LTRRSYFISDNAAGVHPEVLAALADANRGHAVAYGDDAWTERTTELLRRHFGAASRPFLTLTGTGANVLALQSVLESWQAVICADCSHLNRDECGAPEKFIGAKLLPAPTRQGKLTPAVVERLLCDNEKVHRAQPRVVSIAECTEWGTVYTPDELKELAVFCHGKGLLLHMDGARLANAAAALDTSLAALTTERGVDIISFGGTKNGLMGAEAVIFADAERARSTGYYRKQAMQLASKMRFVAAQLEILLASDLWLRSARHANAMAARLAQGLDGIKGVEIVMPVETNAVFARMSLTHAAELQRTHVFAVWDSRESIVRWMTSFDTTAEDVDGFVLRISAVVQNSG
jgi:threonine aldolase